MNERNTALSELPDGVTLEDLLIPLRAALSTCHDTDWSLRQFKTHITRALAALQSAQPAAKCDGNHGGPRCADPECWNDSPAQPAAAVSDGIVKAIVAQAIGAQNVEEFEANVRAILALRPAAQAGEREAFEAWASRQSWFIPFMTRRRDMAGSTRIGQYVDPDMQAGWQAWQARASLPTQPAAQAGEVPKGFTLVPITKAQVDQACKLALVSTPRSVESWIEAGIRFAEEHHAAMLAAQPAAQTDAPRTCPDACKSPEKCCNFGCQKPAKQATPEQSQHDGTRGPFDGAPMNAEKAAYFMRRFKREEKLLGPNEQLAIDFVLALLDAQQATPEPVGKLIAWSPALTYPGYEDQRVWANGKPRQEDIDYWQKNGNGITYAYTRPAPGVPDFASLLKIKEPDGCAENIEQADRQEARCNGWNDCRDEVLNILAAAQAKGADHV